MALRTRGISCGQVARLAACVMACAGTALHGQSATVAVGAIDGVVRGADGKPIPDVEISTPSLARSVRSDTIGEFFLGGLPGGKVELRFRRLAYAPTSVTISIEPHDTVSIVVTLTVVALQLNAVVVNEDAARIRIMHDFEMRRKQGFGHFITRHEIEERDPRLLSDLVRRIPGTSFSQMPGGGRAILHFTRALSGPGRTCDPMYFVDGQFVQGFNIDDVPPSDVEGVELYGGAAVVPPQFNNPRGNASCGVVVIWTRVP